MKLVNRAISSLFNGVSQQSPSVRLPSQCELQENALSTIVEGVHKRHPTNHVAKLSTGQVGDAYVHVINRDGAERYVVLIKDQSLEVWDINGVQKTVNAPDGFSYLTLTDPNSQISMVTVADYTFIANKTKMVTMGSASAIRPINIAYFAATQIIQGTTYAITVDGIKSTVATGTSNNLTATMETLKTSLATALGGGYTVTRLAETAIIKVVKNNGTAMTTKASDGVANNYLIELHKEVPTYNLLPAVFEEGYAVKIQGIPGNAQTSYYVKFVSNSWVETRLDGLTNSFNLMTMPFKLVRESNGTFTFAKNTWVDRLVGDTLTAPQPTFVGRYISDMFFFRNRLGFLADENVILSRAGDYFNLWPSTAVQVLDDDPIDISVSHVKVSLLRHAIPFNKNLLLFSDMTQFMLTAENALTPKTVALHSTTEYECEKAAKPVAAGSNVYFSSPKGNYSGIYEYYVMPYQETYEADDVTAHVPSYVPGNITKMLANTNNDLLFVLSAEEQNALYTYKFYWKGEEKVQSSWSKWIFDEGAKILSMDMMDTKLYLIVQRSDGVFLEYIDIQTDLTDEDIPVLIHLDRKVHLTGTYSSVTGKTTWTVPYTFTTAECVKDGTWVDNIGEPINVTKVVGQNQLEASGDYSAHSCIVGINYTMRYRFSAQFLKDSSGSAIANSVLKLRSMDVLFTNTGYIRAEVKPEGRDAYTYVWAGKVLGTPTATIGVINVGDGSFHFPVLSDSLKTKIDIVNDTFLPCFFQSAEWVGMFHSKARRV